jgi:hypothetical protein
LPPEEFFKQSGFAGRILLVDLTAHSLEVEAPEEIFTN